jgi:hypothetical protein
MTTYIPMKFFTPRSYALLALTLLLATVAVVCASCHTAATPLLVGTGTAAVEGGVAYAVQHGGLDAGIGNLLLNFVHDIANGITVLSPKVQAMQAQIDTHAQQLANTPNPSTLVAGGGAAGTATALAMDLGHRASILARLPGVVKS